MSNKISKTYKIASTVHNTAGRLEKGLIIVAFVTTGIKFLASIVMDKSGKTFKNNRR